MTNHVVNEDLRIDSDKSGFQKFHGASSNSYVGLSEEISLYPNNSAYSNEKWRLSIMFPKEDVDAIFRRENLKLFIAFFILFVLSLLLADFISRKYISPVLSAINSIKNSDYSAKSKTKIIEIDDLLEYLSAEDDSTEIIQKPKQKVSTENPSQNGIGFRNNFV